MALCEYILDEAVSCIIDISWLVVVSAPSKLGSNKLVALGLKFRLSLRLPLFLMLFFSLSGDLLVVAIVLPAGLNGGSWAAY